MKEPINKELLECRRQMFHFPPVLIIVLNELIYAKLLAQCLVHTKCSISSSNYFYGSILRKRSIEWNIFFILHMKSEHEVFPRLCGGLKPWLVRDIYFGFSTTTHWVQQHVLDGRWLTPSWTPAGWCDISACPQIIMPFKPVNCLFLEFSILFFGTAVDHK